MDEVRTDISWLVDKIAAVRADDLACFVHVEMFRNIVGKFVKDRMGSIIGQHY